jgi:hypothetical protein
MVHSRTRNKLTARRKRGAAPSSITEQVHQEKSAIMELHGATWSRMAMIGYHVHACPCSSMGSMQLLIPRCEVVFKALLMSRG